MATGGATVLMCRTSLCVAKMVGMASPVIMAIGLHSLKLTAKAPENRPSQKETSSVIQPSIFRCFGC